MRALSAADVVRAWEAGRDRHPVDRALLLLSLADTSLTWDQVAELTVGQRNGRLLALREATLGATLNGYAECPSCGEALEFSADARAIRLPEPVAATFSLTAEGFDLVVRLVTSRDLAAVGDLADIGQARQLLVERCVQEASRNGEAIAVTHLPDAVVPALAEAMSDHDPQAETRFRLTCFNCQHEWSALFDIVSYFWTEIEAYAKRLLAEVDVLARTYAWREADILSMSSDRRKYYLDLVGE